MFSLFVLILAPVFSLLFLPVKHKNRNLFYGILLLLSVISIVLAFNIQVNTSFDIGAVCFSITIDKFSKIFLILVSCTWFISILYSYEFTKYHFQEKRIVFFKYLNVLLSIVMINACAGNIPTLFVFYVIGIPLTYPLIKLRDNAEAAVSAKIFLKQTLYPSLLLFLPAIVMTQKFIGHLSFSENTTFQSQNIDPVLGGVVLFLFVLGISKNSVFPFHSWLPSTNSAPAPVSGLIHSVATVKTGSIALIKISIYIFGLDYMHKLTSVFLTGGWLTYLCGFTAIYTAFKALKTDDMKKRFAYSTVGQLSYIILAILIGTKMGIMAATIHIVTHAIAKSCLFYVAGFYNTVYNTTSLKEIGRIMPNTKFIAVVIAVCGLSITGFPFLAGYYSKDLMLIEEWHAHYYSSAIFLLLGSFINLLYIIGPVKNAFYKKNEAIVTKPVPKSMLLTFIISIILLVSSNFYVPYFIVLMS